MEDWSDEKRLAYDMLKYTEMCETQSWREKLRKKFEQSVDEGIKEGLDQARRQGIKIGVENSLAKGVEIGIRNAEIRFIRNLLDLGIKPSTIKTLLKAIEEYEFNNICQSKNISIDG